ncbi:MAG: hypothetical protein ACD_30C00092G0005 [uncultured bacterium]|uniref:Uncharacterized protein n=1 Tax=Candidatus Daviesbacteria bacterium GW2011_GWB1_36_5 TaxID=1618426 RepID=A0A0G0F923_9BACT|nr:MAG: hypothetical protein ACD_30C00092G0005 [uncultured bacterium]KKQ10020.1 MAG: hypothetical protein US19_C0009G0022 [Candidatus Daviesbacteria bacterium GW2011_GWB1_36_5]
MFYSISTISTDIIATIFTVIAAILIFTVFRKDIESSKKK